MEQELSDKEQLRQSEALRYMVEGDGWAEAKALLLQKIAQVDSISSAVFDHKTPEQVVAEIQARASTVLLIREWLAEIEGRVEQHLEQQKKPKEEEEATRTDDYVTVHPG